jgi:lipoate-protein ligase A
MENSKKCVIIRQTSIKEPWFNNAMEEYFLKSNLFEDEIIVILWQNKDSVIVGRNQNTVEEINMDFVEKNKISVSRRLSGGGTVYQDVGNVCFTIIKKVEKENSYEFFVQPIIDALDALGIEAEFSGRNDIVVDGKKISGSAQYIYKDRVLHHGTLLFNVNMDFLDNVLKPSKLKLESKSIKSSRARVANIKDYAHSSITVDQFIDHIHHYFIYFGEYSHYDITDTDWLNITKIVQNKYSRWSWIYGQNPEFNVTNTKYITDVGLIQYKAHVVNDLIEKIHFFGDFLALTELIEFENLFINCPFDRKSVAEVLSSVDLSRYFSKLKKEDLVEFIFESK